MLGWSSNPCIVNQQCRSATLVAIVANQPSMPVPIAAYFAQSPDHRLLSTSKGDILSMLSAIVYTVLIQSMVKGLSEDAILVNVQEEISSPHVH